MEIWQQAAAASAILITWGMWPAITEARNAIRFAQFKRRVAAIWRAEICAKDRNITEATGDHCWLLAFEAGQTPREAVHGTEF